MVQLEELMLQRSWWKLGSAVVLVSLRLHKFQWFLYVYQGTVKCYFCIQLSKTITISLLVQNVQNSPYELTFCSLPQIIRFPATFKCYASCCHCKLPSVHIWARLLMGMWREWVRGKDLVGK